MRLFRTIMLLTGVTVFMPSPPENANQGQTQLAAGAGAGQGFVVTAAQTVSDVATFCTRQPEVCQTAGYLAGKLEAKAKYSVRLIYEWANESTGEPQVSPYVDQADSTDPIKTGSTVLAAASSEADGQSTLRLEDLIPEWRGPVSHKKG